MGRPTTITDELRKAVVDAYKEFGTILAAKKATGLSYGSCWNIIDAHEKDSPALHKPGADSEAEASTTHDTASEEPS